MLVVRRPHFVCQSNAMLSPPVTPAMDLIKLKCHTCARTARFIEGTWIKGGGRCRHQVFPRNDQACGNLESRRPTTKHLCLGSSAAVVVTRSDALCSSFYPKGLEKLRRNINHDGGPSGICIPGRWYCSLSISPLRVQGSRTKGDRAFHGEWRKGKVGQMRRRAPTDRTDRRGRDAPSYSGPDRLGTTGQLRTSLDLHDGVVPRKWDDKSDCRSPQV